MRTFTIVMTLFFYWQKGRSGIGIQHHYLVPPPGHPLTYQVRPFTVLLLHTGTYKFEKKDKHLRRLEGGKVTFLCMQKCE